MKSMMILFLALATCAIACVSSAAQIEPGATDTPARFIDGDESPAGAVWWPATPAPAGAVKSCAVVTADQALHLRSEPSADSEVLTWLLHGDVVVVISKSDLNWTRVRFEGFEGFARSDYLEEKECSKP